MNTREVLDFQSMLVLLFEVLSYKINICVYPVPSENAEGCQIFFIIDVKYKR